jgi:hypothetical protein
MLGTELEVGEATVLDDCEGEGVCVDEAAGFVVAVGFGAGEDFAVGEAAGLAAGGFGFWATLVLASKKLKKTVLEAKTRFCFPGFIIFGGCSRSLFSTNLALLMIWTGQPIVNDSRSQVLERSLRLLPLPPQTKNALPNGRAFFI